MAAHINIFQAHRIHALPGTTMGAPITIAARRDGVNLADEVTFFTDDFALSRKLAEAINATVREHNAELAVEPAPVEEAA